MTMTNTLVEHLGIVRLIQVSEMIRLQVTD